MGRGWLAVGPCCVGAKSLVSLGCITLGRRVLAQASLRGATIIL